MLILIPLVLAPAAALHQLAEEPAGRTEEIEAAAARVPADNIRSVVRTTPTDPQVDGMVLVPSGDVLVGTDPADVARLGQTEQTAMTAIAAETPRHTVSLDSYYIDLTEVTNLQWRVFLEATGRKPAEALVIYAWPGGDIPAGGEYLPITNVNIPEIRQYLEWCGKRLPNEAEWTRAARGDDDRVFPWGTLSNEAAEAEEGAKTKEVSPFRDWPRGDKKNPYRCQYGMIFPQEPKPVGTFPAGASPFGVLDMSGNVWEWVDSKFEPFEEDFEPIPFKQGRQPVLLTPEFDATKKVLKGGGFEATKVNCRIDARMGFSPTASDAALGFRAVRSIPPGIEAIRHGLNRLQPSQFAADKLDEVDIFSHEITDYDPTHKVITGYRYLGFAHRGVSKKLQQPLSRLRSSSVEEPIALGVLVTSEPLRMEDMDDPQEVARASAMQGRDAADQAAKARATELAQRKLPAGEYVIAFKSEGESKKYKAAQAKLRKNDKQDDDEEEEPAPDEKKDDKKKPKSKQGKEEPAEGAPAPAESTPVPGAVAPWPGVGTIHDIVEDIAFPQDRDVLLFLNSNNVVVGWQKLPEESIGEREAGQRIQVEGGEDGTHWTVDFPVPNGSKKELRVTLPLTLGRPLN